jgi:hypothetical protein
MREHQNEGRRMTARTHLILGAMVVSALLLASCGGPWTLARVETLQAVDDVDVAVVDVSSAGAIELVVRNAGDDDWLVQWDESSFVRPDGQAVRLLADYTAGDRTVQPPSPLPAGSMVRQRCWLESGRLVGRKVPGPVDATLTLVLTSDKERRSWQGRLVLDRNRPADWDGDQEDARRQPSWASH